MKRPLNPSTRCGLDAAWCVVTDAGSQTILPLLRSAFSASESERGWSLSGSLEKKTKKPPAGCTHPRRCHSCVARKYPNLKLYILLLTLMAGGSISPNGVRQHVWQAESLTIENGLRKCKSNILFIQILLCYRHLYLYLYRGNKRVCAEQGQFWPALLGWAARDNTWQLVREVVRRLPVWIPVYPSLRTHHANRVVV